MMKTIAPILFATSALMLGACAASLDVEHVGAGPQTGLVYALPMTQFKIDVTRQITVCDQNGIQVKNLIKIEKVSVEDPDHIYSIRPESLSHFFNAASTSVEFHEGTRQLASINSSVEDKSGSALVSAVNAVAGFMTAGSLGGMAAVPLGGAKSMVPGYCAPHNATLLAVANQKKKSEQLVKDIKKKVLAVSRLTAEQASHLPGNLPSVDQRLGAAVKQLSSLKAQANAEAKELQSLLKPISHKHETVIWPERGDERERVQPIALPLTTYQQWVGANAGAKEDDVRVFDIFLSLEGEEPQTIASPSGGAKPRLPAPGNRSSAHQGGMNENLSGIRYRTGGKGVLVFREQSHDGKELKRHEDTIAQLGHVNRLPIETGAFGSVSFTAKFDADGGLISAGYKETSAPSEAFMPILDAAATQYTNVAKYRQGKAQAKLDTELAMLNKQLALREAEDKLAPPTPGAQAAAALSAETALLNLQIARLEAEKKLLELQGM